MGSGLDSPNTEDGGSQGSSSFIKSYSSYTEMFEELCPMYMAMGMTYDEYWNGEADRCKYYRKAHELKKREDNRRDYRMGFYIYDAIAKLYPLFNPFASHSKVEPYREYPLPITQADLDEQEKQEIKKKREALIRNMNAKIDLMKKQGMFEKEKDNG